MLTKILIQKHEYYCFMISMPKKIIKIWIEILKELYKKKKSHLEHQHNLLTSIIQTNKNNLYELWQRYNLDKKLLSKFPLNTAKGVSTYLLGFHLTNYAKMKGLLQRIKEFNYDLNTILKHTEINIYDLGCGTAALSQAFLESLHPKMYNKIKLHLIDKNKLFLKTAQKIINLTFKNQIHTSQYAKHIIDFCHFLKITNKKNINYNTYNIFIVGYVWNELQHNLKEKNALLSLLDIFATTNTILLFLDPANTNQCINLMKLRDKLSKQYYPIYPCPSGNNCPMLNTKFIKDRCYSEFQWYPPKEQIEIDKVLKISRSILASTCFVFISPNIHARIASSYTHKVVVGRPHNKSTHHKFSYLICEHHNILNKYPPRTNSTQLLRGELYK